MLILGTFLSAQLVSLDTTEMDLNDFFRFVAKATNFNVVIHPDVQGKVNLIVKDAPWEQVLDSVLKNHALEKEVDGNTLRIAPAATLPLQTHIYFPKYARAAELAPIVATLLSPRGSVVVYTPRNALIVRDVSPLKLDVQ
jgi:type II secretory pathway component HofQ